MNPVTGLDRLRRTLAPALLLVAGTAACGKGGELPAMERPPTPVAVYTATAKDVPLYLDQIGRAVASEVVTLEPRVTGTITEVLFQDGAVLAVNAPLFAIDKRPFEARVAEAAARLTSAEADARQAHAMSATAKVRIDTAKSRVVEAEAGLVAGRAFAEEAKSAVVAAEADAARATADQQRYEDANKGGAVSSLDLDRVRSDARTADARLGAAKRREAATIAHIAEAEAGRRTASAGVAEAESQLVEAEAKAGASEAAVLEARAALDTAKLDLGYATIQSPIAGRAGRRLVDAGNVVTANQTHLLTIQRMDPIHVEFTVTENDLGVVQRHMATAAEAKTSLAVEVRLPDDQTFLRTGKLTFLDGTVNPATGTVNLRATLDNPDGRFWPGRFVRTRLVLETLRGAVLVPASAPQTGAAGTIVYVVKDGATAELRPVTLGQRQDDLVVVTSGVAAGEPVVVTASFTLMPGSKVRVETPPPAGAPPGAPAVPGTPAVPATPEPAMKPGAGS